jgi:hypothetical protein
MKFHSFLLIVAAALLPLSCHLDDGDRCSEGFEYRDGYCLEVDSDSEDTDSTIEDSGVSGLGLVCTSDEDCEGYEADYCAKELGATEGQCTVSNCSTNPDDCPEDLLCCDFPPDGMTAGMPNLCIPQEEYDIYSAMDMCDG